MQSNFHPDVPPWNSLSVWQEANRSFNFLVQKNRSELNRAMALAQEIQNRFVSIFALLDDLCQATCPWCPDPCCLTAKVWIDFKDLLFLHLGGHQIPPKQLMANLRKVCRYWSLKGCVLPRITRPWVCTWYLCPTQKANLRQKPSYTQNKFSRLIQAIKDYRTEMEAEFIRVVS